MILTSPVFQNQKKIPRRYTGEGQDVSPPLEWSEVPKEAREFILICEDPDAPVHGGQNYPFIHWIAYNISPNVSSLPEGIPSNELRVHLPVSLEQGSNSFGKVGYQGPMPPVGSGAHHYRFTLYALNTVLGVRPALTKERLLKAMDGHVISTATLSGVYERKQMEKTA